MEEKELREVETHLQRLCQVLVDRCGSQSAAAKALGCSRREFIRWLVGESTPSGRYFRRIEATCERLQIKSSDASPAAIAVWTPRNRGPVIKSVCFEPAGGRRVYGTTSYTILATGSGFGPPPRGMPFSGFSDRFRISNNAQLGFGEYGYVGDHKKLVYERWLPSEIIVRGFRGRPGDSTVLALWDERGRGAAWGGNIEPCESKTPRIESVTFSGTGRNLRITVNGKNFGPAPRAMPFRGVIDQFSFTDFRSHYQSSSALFGAGFKGFDRHAPHRVKLRYRSWTNCTIRIDGFTGAYGERGAIVQIGDPIAIVIWNARAKTAEGPQTAWGGFVTPRRIAAVTPWRQ